MADQTKIQSQILSNEFEKEGSVSFEKPPAVGVKQPVTVIEEEEEFTESKSIKITLMAADGEAFEVEEAVANEMSILKEFILESGCDRDTVIPVPNVEGPALSKVIEYVSRQIEFRAKLEEINVEDSQQGAKEKKAVADEVKEFETSFVKQLDNDFLKDMIMAADYLAANQFLALLKQAAADRIKNKSVDFVRKFFGVESDYTADEERRLHDENPWVFEGVEEDDA